LGGGMPTIHSSTYHILSVLCVSIFHFLYCSRSYFHFSKTQKDQKYFTLVCYLWFALLAIFGLLFEIQNYFAWLLFPFVLVSKIENLKIFVVLLRFCKVCCRVQSLVTPLELGFHFILFKPHKWKVIMTTYDNPRCGKRLVWTLFFHFCTYTHLCGHA
jgi:hypothetical protein